MITKGVRQHPTRKIGPVRKLSCSALDSEATNPCLLFLANCGLTFELKDEAKFVYGAVTEVSSLHCPDPHLRRILWPSASFQYPFFIVFQLIQISVGNSKGVRNILGGCPHFSLCLSSGLFHVVPGYTCQKAMSGHALSIFGWPGPSLSLPSSGA